MNKKGTVLGVLGMIFTVGGFFIGIAQGNEDEKERQELEDRILLLENKVYNEKK